MHPSDSDDGPGLARRAQQLKAEITRLAGDFSRAEVTGSGGGGLVQATLSGEGKIVALELDPSVVDPDNPGSLADLVMDAVNDAAGALTAQRARQISPVTASLQGVVAELRGRKERREPTP